MATVDEEWKQFIQSQTSVGFSLNQGFKELRSPMDVANPKFSGETKYRMKIADSDGRSKSAIFKKPTEYLTKPSRKPEFQGFTESAGRSKSAIFGTDENSDELRSPEFPRPEYFTVSYENLSCNDPELEIFSSDEIAMSRIPPITVLGQNELYISTKTKVLFLNQEIDIKRIFWEIPVEEYWKPVNCVVKKQMKIVSKSPEEYAEIVEKLKKIPYYTENVIKQINNPTARRIKFKDERKITVGLSKKDIMNCRGKVKNAFYNCFAIIVRFRYEDAFREIHVKVFNTGKLEIPGVLNAEILDIMRGFILQLLQPYTPDPLAFLEYNTDENVLINSNFNCGFYIHREKLFSILRSEKYGIETSYDPCIYPGIKCKYYFNNELGFSEEQTGKITVEDRGQKMYELGNNKKYTEVSFMIFRTGSCLIVGNCSERILVFIFEFIKQLLINEFPVVAVPNEDGVAKVKKTKLRKKSINVSTNYHASISSVSTVKYSGGDAEAEAIGFQAICGVRST